MIDNYSRLENNILQFKLEVDLNMKKLQKMY